MAKVKQFKGYGNLRGLVYGVENAKLEFDNYKKEVKKAQESNKPLPEFKGKNLFVNKTMTKLNLRLKTSNDNSVFLEILQFNSLVNGEVYLFNTEKGNVDKKVVAWDERYSHGTTAEEKKNGNHGFEPIGVRVRGGEDTDTHNLLQIDAISYVVNKFKDGDSVFVSTEISHSERGDKKYTSNAINKMFLTSEPLDLDSDEFVEISDFQDMFVLSDIMELEDEYLVSGKWLDYRGEFVNVDYVIEDKDVAEYIQGNVSVGSKLSVEGVIHNRVVYKETESTEVADEDKPLVGSKRKSFQNRNFNREIESEKKYYEICAINEVLEGAYSEQELSKQPAYVVAKKEEKMPWE